jgi:hypothetical protein
MYVAADPASAVAESLAQFRGSAQLDEEMLDRGGVRLALAALELPDDAPLLDLDDPRTLVRERLRPSRVATAARTVTQAYATHLFDAHPDALGLRWWSTLESSWINVTLFDRAAPALTPGAAARVLTPDDQAVTEAAELLGLA